MPKPIDLWRKHLPPGFRGNIRIQGPVPETSKAQLDGVNYAALECKMLAQILAACRGARAVHHIHDEILIEVGAEHVQH